MMYDEAKSMTEKLVKDEYGFAQLLELAKSANFTKEGFDNQLRAYIAEFGADEQDVMGVIEDMANVTRKLCDEYANNEDIASRGMVP